MYNVKGEDGNWSHTVQIWEFSKEDIEQVKHYVNEIMVWEIQNISITLRNFLIYLRRIKIIEHKSKGLK